MHEKLRSILGAFLPIVHTFKSGLQKQILEKALDRASGMEVERENPDRLLRDRGKDEELYDVMLLDDRIKLATNLKKRLVLSVPANIVPASEEEKDVEIAEEVENQLKIKGKSKYQHAFGYSFSSFLDNGMDAALYGYKVCEKVFSIQGDRAVFTTAKFKHSKFFDFNYDEFGNLNRLLIGKDFGEEQVINGVQKINDKFIVFTYPYIKDGNVYGDSELVPAYKLWRSKVRIQKARDIHLEKWGMPIPAVIYDAVKTKPSEKTDLEELLQNFQEGTYFLLPGYRNEEGELKGKMEFSITEAKSGEFTRAYENTIDQLDKQITRVILFPDKLGFTESPGGSYNQAETQLEVLQVVIEYTHKWLEYHINNQLIKQIVDLNFTNVENYPMLKFDRVSDKIKAEMLKTLIDAGVVDKREQWIRPAVGIPILSQEEQEVIEEAKEEDHKKFLEGKVPGGAFPNPTGDEKGADKKKPDMKDPDNNKPPEKMQRKSNPFDSKAVKKFFDNEEENFVIQYDNIMRKNGEDVINQIRKKKLVENKDIKGAETLRMPKMELKKLLTQSFAKWFLNGKVQAVEEVKDRISEENILKFKKGRKYQSSGMTSIDGSPEHSHAYEVDMNGNGQTTSTNGGKAHVHQVIGFEVMAGGVEAHTHDLSLAVELKLDVTFKKVGVTSIASYVEHSHGYEVDGKGNGQTLSTNGEGREHVHQIIDFAVMKSGTIEHQHELELEVQKFKEDNFLDKVFIDRFLEKAGALGELTAADRESLKLIRERGFQITGLEEERLLKQAKLAISEGARSGETVATVTSNIRNILGKDRDKFALTIARTNMADHYNTGRMNFFTSPRMSQMIEAYQYQAIIDDATTIFCQEHDGQVIKAGDGKVAQINPPNHFNCRSVLVPIMIEEKNNPDSYFYEYENRMDTFGAKVTKPNPEPGFGGPVK